MIAFSDTDIVLKLSACDLLNVVLATLGITHQEVFVLRDEITRTCLYNEEVAQEYTQEVLNRAVLFAYQARPITQAIDPEEQAYMEEARIVLDYVESRPLYGSIDSGEQVVFGATRSARDFRVLTNDRKALLTLTRANGCGGICTRMNGRVLCLEQILLLAIEHIGYESVQQATSLASSHDAAFRILDEAGADSNKAQSALAARITELRLNTGDLLAA